MLDSLVVGVERPRGDYYMPLFIVLRPGAELDDALKGKIRDRIRSNLTPHHVPDEVFAIAEVPRPLNGKKLEVPVKKLFMGAPLEKAISMDSMGNPQVMQYFIEFVTKFS